MFLCVPDCFQGHRIAHALEDEDSAYPWSKRQACLPPVMKGSGALSPGDLS